jgi:Fur family transcriptional regulator, ferric uptake regulator
MTTRQDIIRRALAEAGTFISAQDLHGQLRSGGHRIGLATVYRALHALARDGVADTLRDGDGRHLYRACGSREHHHHLLCRACGAAVEVPASALERWAAAVSGEHGFTNVTLIAEFFGTCAGCSPTRSARKHDEPGPGLSPQPARPRQDDQARQPAVPAGLRTGRRLTGRGPAPAQQGAAS